MKLGRSIDLKQSYCDKIRNIWRNTTRFQWSQKVYLEARSALYAEDGYQRMPQWCKQFVSGYDYALSMAASGSMVFGYVIDGRFVPTKSTEWKKNDSTYYERQRNGEDILSSASAGHAWPNPDSRDGNPLLSESGEPCYSIFHGGDDFVGDNLVNSADELEKRRLERIKHRELATA